MSKELKVNGSCSPWWQLEQQCEQLRVSEPQQQSRQPEQQRISCCLALSVDIDNQARNRTVYGLSERGFGSPGSIPEL